MVIPKSIGAVSSEGLSGRKCLSVNKLNDLSDLCFGARREIGAADVDQREPRSLRPEQASLPK